MGQGNGSGAGPPGKEPALQAAGCGEGQNSKVGSQERQAWIKGRGVGQGDCWLYSWG